MLQPVEVMNGPEDFRSLFNVDLGVSLDGALAPCGNTEENQPDAVTAKTKHVVTVQPEGKLPSANVASVLVGLQTLVAIAST
ncbi:unnamed protein product [Schistocephalus solidus]|uniref:Uncharacterized protein n=1 Tax=Schistocephalus solidus TaxID=70667 RepID=A0A183THI6_SCHSO|nr:unnamed protein product [Schistocephalus solidus]